MRYISHYEEYPIYEPAEGGYYYAGNQLVESEWKSKHACKKELHRIWQECEKDNEDRGFREDNHNEWINISSRTREYPWIFNRELNFIHRESYYIGEGESYVIEKRQGSMRKGYEPYC